MDTATVNPDTLHARPIIATGEGRNDATAHGRFVCAYNYVETDRFCGYDGSAPDGRQTCLCDRCGTGLRHIYVFATDDGTSQMHVGIDCAEKMGVSLDELARARRWFDDEKRRLAFAERERQNRAAEALRQTEEAARLAAAGPVVAELHALAANPACTAWEQKELAWAVRCIAQEGTGTPTNAPSLWLVGAIKMLDVA